MIVTRTFCGLPCSTANHQKSTTTSESTWSWPRQIIFSRAAISQNLCWWWTVENVEVCSQQQRWHHSNHTELGAALLSSLWGRHHNAERRSSLLFPLSQVC